ncbi:Eco57I restriction-modification methylase domain-containing protein [Candidatus Leptofilum sp.]|uniref:Eco57I restriction-modification methylase domain-containing protein n=1 Tax=Candidatus Leptofilum sp. TaxID=3241576 RepID=UPI003B5A70C6
MPDTPFQPRLDFGSHNNQSLFSDHYLQEILRRTPEWKAWQTPAAYFLAWLRDLYAAERDQLTNYNESQLEDNWIKPILVQLGHVWEGQASIPGLKGKIKKPDFALFPDEAARQTAVPHQNTPLYTKDVLALLEAKKWTVNLSKKSGPLPRFDDQNPMYQIDTYLTLSSVTWGVVSNGRFWRLVHKNSSRTLETYFEIDLLAALHAPAETNTGLAVATFFWAFFNQKAFTPDAHGNIFLDEALSQSRAYAIALEADLRDNAYRSLEQLIIGFFAGDASLDAQNAAHRDQVYQNSLYLLYRLLFLFYGEARALLPMGNPTYKNEYSLQTLAGDINRERDRLDGLPTTGRRRWDRLQELFRLISGRDAQFNAELGVPRYNGGLFEADQHSFLETHFVGDRALAQAIDYLAYRRVREDGRFRGFQAVDYRTLDVRQLGSIYEGLLEYKVAVAREEMVTIRKKGVETWVPNAKKGRSKTVGAARQPGELYLTTDKGERKATGSYYTPDYIVEYIVENTLGPLVEQARERVKAQIRQTGSLDEAERQRQSAALFVQEILALNVLDPAMGSGHFLVEAMNFLAIALATDEYVIPDSGSGRSPTAPASSHEGQGGTVAQDAQRLATAEDPETDLLYWKRRVVEACIYGVDKNPMAVELAKLSLWLKTAASDKPLSFLDHHLQHGDSLIGAWLDDLQAPPNSKSQTPISNLQSPLFNDSAFTRDASLAVGGVMAIERATTNSIEDVHLKEKMWQELQQTHIARWRKLADLWVSAYFGNAMTPEEYRALAAYLQPLQQPPGGFQQAASQPPGGSTSDSLSEGVSQPQPPGGFQPDLLSEVGSQPPGGSWLNHFLQHPAVTDNDYFHWELAFPEVFFDEYGRSRQTAAGFDAVIGNPPYVVFVKEGKGRQSDFVVYQVISEGESEYYEQNFNLVEYAPNTFSLMTELSMSVLANGCFFGFIYPSTILYYYYHKTLRTKLTNETSIKSVVQLDHVFEDAETGGNAVIILEKSKPDSNFTQVLHIPTPEHLRAVKGETVTQKDFLQIPWSQWTTSPHLLSLLQKSKIDCTPFENLGEFYQGVCTGNNKKWIGTDSTNPLSVKVLRGKDIHRYSTEWAGEYLIFDKPNMWSNTNEDFLEANPKILLRQTSDSIVASIDHQGLFLIDSLYLFRPNTDLHIHYLLAILNSSLMNVLYQFYSPEENRTFAQVKVVNLKPLPVKNIEISTPPSQRKAVVNTAKNHYEQGNTPALLAWADAELAANRNDTLHDLLAHLAEQMITLNQQKQAALEAFWLDLEGVTDPKPFETLRHKGKWEQSLHKNVPAARPYVDAASRSTITLDATLGWNEDAFKGMVKELVGTISGLSKLVQVYREHAPSVAALNHRLATTDYLIDQIVYKLYNLTPTEIAIVEGK